MRAGIDRASGRLLTGWDHCVQSIAVILTTRVGTRVMRRAFGSAALELQDRSATPMRIMQIYAAVAAAIRTWEPGFRLKTIQLTRGGADGVFAFEITGIFYPRGHLGDYETFEERSAVLGSNENGFVQVAA
ncbi:MAG: baseplate assembly protein [Chelatococcus sp.]|nr:MAG: baseplate assembly protein [Chelatococcus sp.]